jgi:hypothetical protein
MITAFEKSLLTQKLQESKQVLIPALSTIDRADPIIQLKAVNINACNFSQDSRVDLCFIPHRWQVPDIFPTC